MTPSEIVADLATCSEEVQRVDIAADPDWIGHSTHGRSATLTVGFDRLLPLHADVLEETVGAAGTDHWRVTHDPDREETTVDLQYDFGDGEGDDGD